MKTVISRRYRSNETTGKLIVFDQDNKVLELVSLELPDCGNQKNCSCIPEGIYTIIKSVRPDTGANVFRILNVLNRENILIHILNYAAGEKIQTLGCIGVGMRFLDINHDGNIDIADSTKAMNKLLSILPDESTLIII